ncbi:MAG: hypothetical protein DRQ04_06560 [Candidatus Hydrothermota bacterium]|nr:MAG: hypothetical protein DRQ04_06560 [Candidatus Hydrothermae bacterium]
MNEIDLIQALAFHVVDNMDVDIKRKKTYQEAYRRWRRVMAFAYSQEDPVLAEEVTADLMAVICRFDGHKVRYPN